MNQFLTLILRVIVESTDLFRYQNVLHKKTNSTIDGIVRSMKTLDPIVFYVLVYLVGHDTVDKVKQ